MEGDTQK
jgi:ADP-ribosylarginine hydrolase